MNKEIRRLRINYGLTQIALAQRAQVSLPTIQNIESGKANPSLLLLEKILSVLGAKLEIRTKQNQIDILYLFNTDLLEFKQINLASILAKLQQDHNLNPLTGRELDLLVSLYCAIYDHYPNWLLQEGLSKGIHSTLRLSTKKVEINRLIKFRRIWLNKLSQVL